MEKNYPNHDRVPNVVVRGLYHVGYFIGDFVPMFLNMIDGMYWSIKRLVAFIVGLLVDSSIFIVVISSIAFSVGHSIELLREVGAQNGREYFGVAMFEVIYLGSSATLTRFLMKKRKPVGFVGWMGLLFTLLGFLIGLGFVWWSNVHGLEATTEGRVVGSLVPLLVLIGEGILAFRYMSEIQQDDITSANTSKTNNTNNHDNSNHRHNRNANTMIANNNDNVNDDNSDQRQQGKTDKDNKATNTADKSDNDSAAVRNTLQHQQHSNNDDNDDSNTNDRRSMNANNGDNNNQHGRNTTNANNNHNDNNDTTKKVVNMNERRKKRRELDPDTVLAIFRAKGSNAHIGKQFGVSAETVRKIKNGERHANVTAPYRQRQAK